MLKSEITCLGVSSSLLFSLVMGSVFVVGLFQETQGPQERKTYCHRATGQIVGDEEPQVEGQGGDRYVPVQGQEELVEVLAFLLPTEQPVVPRYQLKR